MPWILSEKSRKRRDIDCQRKTSGSNQKKRTDDTETVDESRETLPVKACTAEEYKEIPDVILVCVKGYSMDETVPTIKKIAGKETVVIPILNIYGTGGRLQKKLPELTVTDGCIYVSANIMEPGVILQHGKILRVVFGARKPEEETEKMREVAKDMVTDDLEVILS